MRSRNAKRSVGLCISLLISMVISDNSAICSGSLFPEHYYFSFAALAVCCLQ